MRLCDYPFIFKNSDISRDNAKHLIPADIAMERLWAGSAGIPGLFCQDRRMCG
jgi:hypothetical protein